MKGYKELAIEADKLGIHFAGLKKEKLIKRIEDKKNGTGIYQTSIVDPDLGVEKLLEMTESLGIKTYHPSLSQSELVEAINKKIGG